MNSFSIKSCFQQSLTVFEKARIVCQVLEGQRVTPASQVECCPVTVPMLTAPAQL